MPNPNDMWIDTEDLDQRFEAREATDNVTGEDDRKLREDILKAIKLSDKPSSLMDDSMRSGLNGPMAVTLIRDKLTGNQTAAVAYDSVKDDWRESEVVVTKYQLLDVKNGKLLTEPVDDHESPNAKRKLGIDQDIDLLPESITVGMDDMTGKQMISPDHIGKLLTEAQNQSRLDVEQEVANNRQSPLMKSIVFDKMANEFVEQRVEAIEDNERLLERKKEVVADIKQYSPEERQEAYENSEYLKDKLAEQRAEGLDVLNNPQKLHINSAGKMEISDGAELTTRFVQLNGRNTTDLGDIHKKFKIGRLSDNDIRESNQIMASDKVVGGVRLVENDDRTEYNIYAIEKDGVDDGPKEGWVRAEKFDRGELVAVNGQALRDIGIEDNQLNTGVGKSDAVRRAVSPESLRQSISESQHIDYTAQLMANIAADEGNPDADTYREYKAADYTDSKRYDLSAEEHQALHNIDSAYVDSRYKVLPVPPKKIEQMERLGVIPRANDEESEHYKYIGSANVFVIKDSETNETHTFGQTLEHKSAGYPGASKSYDISEFELVTDEAADRVRVLHEKTINPGQVVWDHQHIEGDDSIKDVLGEQLSVSRNGTKYYAANSDGLHNSSYTPRDIMESVVDASSKDRNRDMSKLENNYGLGEKHETVEALNASQETEITHTEKYSESIDSNISNAIQEQPVRRRSMRN